MTYNSAVGATSLPESICGRDDRVRVNPENVTLNSWICSLLITEANGAQWVGSGFKIHIPNVTASIVVTSAHCVYLHGAYARSIRVTFPGQAAVTIQGAADLYASPEYRNSSTADYDYGIIIMPGNSNEGFGLSTLIPDNELSQANVTNCGYPGDKQPWPQMWTASGGITQVTANRLYYMNDTMGGQSGSPVYYSRNGDWTAVGVHSYGGCPNSAPRITREMIYRFLERAQLLKKYSLRSAQFTNVYIRCDGSGMTSSSGSGGGTINCQFKPPSLWETFYTYPVEISSSLAQQQKYIVVLQSCQFKKIFVRMDGRGMTKPEGPGGGVVNCQFSEMQWRPSTWESFFLKIDQSGKYSFRSVQFPNCYIRLDGNGVWKQVGPGGGVVNCQYYTDTGTEPSPWEKFIPEAG